MSNQPLSTAFLAKYSRCSHETASIRRVEGDSLDKSGLIELEWPCSPEELLAGWPRDRRLVSLFSGSAEHASGRWCFFSEPSSRVCLGKLASLSNLRDIIQQRRTPRVVNDDEPPFRSGWIGRISYEFGGVLESAMQPSLCKSALPDVAAWPIAEFHRCDWIIAFDRLRRRWWFCGDPDAAVPPLGPAPRADFLAGPFTPSSTSEHYIDMVNRARRYIHDGDCYQVNLTHSMSGPFSGSPRSFFLALCDHARPLFGTYQESEDLTHRRVMASVSPELFLDYRSSTRRVTTRPMKGTRPHASLAEDLIHNTKERAELNMIIDLMRNDLGRVCDVGSVSVSTPRAVESHGAPAIGLLQATATVVGDLDARFDHVDLLAAAFPGGSITGAPKIRAMQIIAELESSSRGPYCGAHGFFDDDGSCCLGMTIRTACITGEISDRPDHFENATLRYGIGAGIVADSDPHCEWLETLDKARVLHAAATASHASHQK